MKARVTVFPRPEVLDPQGKAIKGALERLGFTAVSDLRAGKSFDLELTTADRGEAERQLKEMCEKLLANTLVERYEIELPAEGWR
ncbi:MAG TPA: phosphoribosylformylglycinamidine synthase subunit PurS [Thermoanaerobaculia bacterium]|nr:phosphoribosylformylglycinamidine synthase subunit PurS [Thermoanaerobaculia bacterium]